MHVQSRVRRASPTNRPDRVCATCGTRFHPKAESTRFCSRACFVGRPLADRFWPKVARIEGGGCWPWTAYRDDDGYGRINVGGRQWPAQRVAWTLTYGPIPEGQWVLHRCDTPACVRPDHLFLGTVADNNADRDAKGRSAQGDANGARLHPERMPRGARNGRYTHPESVLKGERNGRARLEVADVLTIRRRYAERDASTRRLALEFNVSNSQVKRIVAGHGWRHVAQ